ncbi:MAG: tetraacyldisaccharide 4'-kinase [Pseudomonadota bacterium]|nr:tetraacyldisaccharide 4'-kinase [Pseudomonadota bacterium]
MKAPKFWYYQKSVLGKMLNPLGRIYGWSVARRFKRVKPYQAGVPVICVGNLSVGGTGKTPVALAIGKMMQEMNIPFFFLNHGYKSKKKTIIVDTIKMSALEVGDEAMLLAMEAPTVVDNHRARGAQLAERSGAKAIIMDDGFQNPSLIKTLSLVVVDGKTGFGNGRLIPAGPLRESVSRGLLRADAVIISGQDEARVTDIIREQAPDMPIFTGHFEPDEKVIQKWRGKKVMAFAGIGRPEKFFEMLKLYGVSVVKTAVFPDHYDYTQFDLDNLISEAGQLPLMTTTKDFVKVPQNMKAKIVPVAGQFIFDNPAELQSLLKGILVP